MDLKSLLQGAERYASSVRFIWIAGVRPVILRNELSSGILENYLNATVLRTSMLRMAILGTVMLRIAILRTTILRTAILRMAIQKGVMLRASLQSGWSSRGIWYPTQDGRSNDGRL